MMLLAETPPPPEALSSWLSVMFYLVGGATACVLLFREITGKRGATEISGQPLEVKAHAGTVTRRELDETHGRISRERKEINDAIVAVREDMRERTDKLEQKLDENTKMTSHMSGQLGGMDATLGNLSNALTNYMRDQARTNR